jgi:hypothetical protein
MNTVIHRSHGNSPEQDVSVQAAAVLLSLAIRDTDTPVRDLGQALSRLVTKSALQRAAGKPDEQMERDLAVCVQSLQFHDRLIQQLAAVRNLLTSLGTHGPLEVEGFGAQRWEELLAALKDRLSADSHNQLFDLLMRTGKVDNDLLGDALPNEGSVELF